MRRRADPVALPAVAHACRSICMSEVITGIKCGAAQEQVGGQQHWCFDPFKPGELAEGQQPLSGLHGAHLPVS